MQAEQIPQTLPRLLRFPVVMALTGKSRSGIYDAISRGKFPKPVKLGTRSVAFLASEIDAWIEGLTAARDDDTAA